MSLLENNVKYNNNFKKVKKQKGSKYRIIKEELKRNVNKLIIYLNNEISTCHF